jgi:ribosomal protein S18 acetylase RimI-like enzyme
LQILTYRELERKSVLLPLMEQAFGWPFDPQEFEKTIKADPRLRDGCIGFCAVDGGKLVGYVGVMDLATRTLQSTVEMAGGIYGVATLPGHTRRGICGALLNRAHEYFKQRGYRFAFLTTSPTLVAYGLYEKLGYFEVTSFPGVYKVKVKGEKKHNPSCEEPKLDFDRMLEIYCDYVKNRTGFVVRNKAYMKMLAKTHEIAARECIIAQRGYIIFKREKKQVRIRELIAHDHEEMNRLVGQAEDRAQTVVYGRAILDPALRNVCESRGFTVLEGGHGVLMVKELIANASFNEAYGDVFFMSALDHF